MQKKWIVAAGIAFLLVIAVVLIICLVQSNAAPTDLREIVGEEIPLSQGVSVC